MKLLDNYIKKIIFATSLLQSITTIAITYEASSHSSCTGVMLTDQLPTKEQAIPVITGHNSFYYSIMLGYLLPFLHSKKTFQGRLSKLIGQYQEFHNYFYSYLCHWYYADNISSLLLYPFPYFIRYMKIYLEVKQDKNSVEWRMQEIANQLNVTIEKYKKSNNKLRSLTLFISIRPWGSACKQLPVLKILEDEPSDEELLLPKNHDQDRWIKPTWNEKHYRPLLAKKSIKPLQIWRNQKIFSLLPFPSREAIMPMISIPKNLRELCWSTSPYECVILNKHTRTHITKESQKVRNELSGWKLYKKLVFENKRYKAIIYHNRNKKQMVLVYYMLENSTTMGYPCSLLTSVNTTKSDKKVELKKDLLYSLDALKNGIHSQKDSIDYGVTITGYLEGGKLAQVAMLVAYYQHDLGVNIGSIKAITFNSTGARDTMLGMFDYCCGIKKDIDLLDITNYYSTVEAGKYLGISPGSCYNILPLQSNQQNIHDTLDNVIQLFDPELGSISSKHEIRVYDMEKLPTSSCNMAEYKPYLLHTRHIPTHLRKWLIKMPSRLPFFHFLQRYLTPVQSKNQVDFWETQKLLFDTRIILDALLSLQKKQYSYLLNPCSDGVRLSQKIQRHPTIPNNLPEMVDYASYRPLGQSFFDTEINLYSSRLTHGYVHYYLTDYCPASLISCIRKYLGRPNRYTIKKSEVKEKNSLLKFAYQELRRCTYHHIWWIDCNNFRNSIEGFYKNLYRENLHFSRINENNPRAHIKKLLEHLSGWLLIVDNATSEVYPPRYLPSGSSGHTLIVSLPGNSFI